MKQPKFQDGQLVRVIGADWTMRPYSSWQYWGFDYWSGSHWWPEYLLESA